VRDAKIEEARKLIEQKEADLFKPKINKTHLPEGYKGPITGYYDKVNRYFGKKELLNHIGNQKPLGVPRINDQAQTLQSGSVEDRLLRKGEEYKSKRH
jgi:hypothetical protein